MWHVSSRNGVAALRTAIHLLLTYLPTCIVNNSTTLITSNAGRVKKQDPNAGSSRVAEQTVIPDNKKSSRTKQLRWVPVSICALAVRRG